ncbi:MAG TPA: GIY-YIG nuclease family protein [Dehalococcoidia bacterium]|nr:GIY-YIG nuclease family protein [Dehalococcoidia bacterium]
MVQLDVIDPHEKGGYVLLVRLKEGSEIRIGKLGTTQYDPGYYAYVGSAMRGLKQRILRHLRKEKKLHWHIDYLLEQANVSNVIVCKSGNSIECDIADAIGTMYNVIKGFGSSDCKCTGHLFYSPFSFSDKIMKKLQSIGMKPSLIPVTNGSGTL